MTASADGTLYVGEVVHKRARPKRHSLRYGVYSMLVDLDRLAALDRRLRLFSVNRFNLFSLVERDFGPRDGSPLAAFIRRRARSMGIADVSRIAMLCYPRLLGFAFNPITVYYLYDATDALRALIYEVNNTFGAHHFYETVVDNGLAMVEHTLPKALYVSPFNTLEGSYRFTVREPAGETFLGITLSDAEGALVTAYFKGARRDLTDMALLKLAVTFPMMTFKVVAAIHWEALRLLLKGVPTTLGLRQ